MLFSEMFDPGPREMTYNHERNQVLDARKPVSKTGEVTPQTLRLREKSLAHCRAQTAICIRKGLNCSQGVLNESGFQSPEDLDTQARPEGISHGGNGAKWV